MVGGAFTGLHGRKCPVFDSRLDAPSVCECIVHGVHWRLLIEWVAWVGCIGRGTSLHEVPDWESWSRLVHERVEIMVCRLSSPFPFIFNTLPHNTFCQH